MDLINLEAFIEVAEKKSFSKSAESLQVTQPAVSKRIAALESELSLKLFDRIGKTVQLTEAGRTLLPSAIKIHAEIDHIGDQIDGFNNVVRGSLNIGCCQFVCPDLIVPALKKITDQHPEVDINPTFLTTAQAIEKIETGRLDMCLCTISSEPLNNPHFKRADIQSEKLHFVVDKQHNLATQDTVQWEDLAKYTGIFPKNPSTIRTLLDQELAKHQINAVAYLEGENFRSMRSLVSAGLGWSCLPKNHITDKLKELHIPGFSLERTVTLLYSADRTLSRAAQMFVKYIQEE